MTSHAAKACSEFFQAPAALRGGAGKLIQRAAILALLARRAIWMTALCRMAPQAPASAALSADEIALIARLAHDPAVTGTLADTLTILAAIGGADEKTTRPHPLAVARGLSHLADLQIARRLRAAKYSEPK